MRFTIRDILWFTTLVAAGIGWWFEHERAAASAVDSRKLRIDIVKREIQLDYVCRDYYALRASIPIQCGTVAQGGDAPQAPAQDMP